MQIHIPNCPVKIGVTALKGTDMVLAPSPNGYLGKVPGDKVIGDRQTYFAGQGISLAETCWLRQLHQNQRHVIEPNMVGQGHNTVQHQLVGDAMMTNVSGAVLCLKVADCIPVVIYSADGRVVAVIHVGRAGLEENILPFAVGHMSRQFGVPVKKLFAYVGPFISTKRYVFDAVKDAEIISWYQLRYAVDMIDGQPHLDMGKVLRGQFNLVGLPLSQVTWDGRCTYDEPPLWSHREMTHKTGNGFDRGNNVVWVQST